MRVSIALARKLLLVLCVTVVLAAIPSILHADNGSATLTVTVIDSSGAVIPSAVVILRNVATDQRESVNTDGRGSISFPFLKAAQYAVLVQKPGFNELSVNDIVLRVGDNRELQVVMKVGSATQTVSVDGSGLTINTTNASVSTVIDRKFVQNIPLNGRSFQDLILLTPGSVTNSPQRSSETGVSGEFSINGQRTESNYYTIDGVSANNGISTNGVGAGPAGGLPASTALGTTQALVSVDALQEFRVESSTYSAEYGRSPGGQFFFVTRSGTNDWHGTAFDYFRNDALDANDWFNDDTVPITPKTPERQNDFGGTLGGPVLIPNIYDGRNRSFFFFSYEGLRLMQPQAASINYVPDAALRASLSGPLQQAINAFPLPTPGAPDLGNGLAEFIAAWSDPSNLDATSIRLDHNLGLRTHLFFRFSDTPSSSITRGTTDVDSSPSAVTDETYAARTYTLGATTHIASHLDNDFRMNYSSNLYHYHSYFDNFGGAVPVDLSSLQGIAASSQVTVGLSYGGYSPRLIQTNPSGKQSQWNLVDTMNMVLGKHSLKVGIDWRRLTPALTPAPNLATYLYTSEAALAANSVSIGIGESTAPGYPLFTNVSLFAQDEWKATSKLNVSAGIRWDVNPAPGITQGLKPYTVSGLDDLSTMSLAPDGTPLWKTAWFNFAPRLGLAYLLNSNAGRELVLRGGVGVFFDTGQQTGSYAFSGPGFSSTSYFGTNYKIPASFPVAPSVVSPPIMNPPVPPYTGTILYTNRSHLQLPYTYEWNVSLEQGLGRSQTMTLSYVGANGRKLLQESELSLAKINPSFGTVYVFQNGLTSSYNSLQVQFQRQVLHGLQALASYTWSHALDFGSYNTAIPYQHGNSDYDVRNNVTAALSYDIPGRMSRPWLSATSSNWGLDARFTGRSGFPVTLNGNSTTDPATGQIYYGGLDLVPNVPLFLYGAQCPDLPGSGECPGGRRINPSAFVLPATGSVGNAPRNFVRGFDAIQTDIALRRTFRIYERLQGQFRAEAFNVFNHPNFGTIQSLYGNAQFGEATASLSQSLGVLSPLYQMGGPRSLQLTLKLSF